MNTNLNFAVNIPLYPQFPLSPVWVAQGSAIFIRPILDPELFKGVKGLKIVLTAPGATNFVYINLDTMTNGAWVEPYLFPTAGKGQYELVGVKEGRRIWFGRGDWNVVESAACGDPSPVVPPSGEINAGYFPVKFDSDGNKLYRKLSIVIEEETEEPVSQWSKNFYRFNLATGVYEEVQDA